MLTSIYCVAINYIFLLSSQFIIIVIFVLQFNEVMSQKSTHMVMCYMVKKSGMLQNRKKEIALISQSYT